MSIVNIIIIVLTALLFSAFFSGMEIAFLSSNRLKLEIDKKQSSFLGYMLDIFVKHPGQYITTILVGNNIALVVYSMYMSELTSHIGIEWLRGSVVFDTVVSTIIIIFLAEFIPKTVFREQPNFFLKALSFPVYVFYILFYPIAKITTFISVILLKIFGLKLNTNPNISSFDKTDLNDLLEQVSDSETPEHKTDTELKLFQNALDFSDLRVRDCMVPRVEIVAIDSKATIIELTQLFVESNYSRIFVYEGSIDNIIGYVNTKSLFKDPKTIKQVLMNVSYVTETMSAQRLLNSFTKNKRSVAVVIDEFGGTAGMVAMEDILEEIFGEIEDEHDEVDTVERRNEDGSYELSCRLEVEYLNEEYGLDFQESDEYETLGGYIIYHHEGLPLQGESLTIENKQITVLKMSGSKLDLVKVSLL
ncbi:MAG: hemolysin family protein [Rikenellaceae bacterium]